VNCAVVLPARSVTDAGTVAADVLLLASVTGAPPAGAGPLRVTVPVELTVPISVDGFNVTELNAGGFTVRLAVTLDPL